MIDGQVSGADNSAVVLRYYPLISGDSIGLGIAQEVNLFREGTDENFHPNTMRTFPGQAGFGERRRERGNACVA